MSLLTRKYDEVRRLQELYTTYHDSESPWLRRKVHVQLDRFLMEHRDIAILCMERVLADEISRRVARNKKRRLRR